MFKNKAPNARNNMCGNNIARLRKELGLSQRGLAAKLQVNGLDLDKNAIQRIESGKRFITDIELFRLCKTLNCSYEEIYAPFSIIQD